MPHSEISTQKIDQIHDSTSNSQTHQPSNAFLEAYKFGADTLAHPDARLRQAAVVTSGAVVGGIKDIPNELINHPWETAGKFAVARVTGVALGTALAFESPAIVSGIVGACTVAGTGIALWNIATKLEKNKQFKQSMDAVYKSSDSRTMLHGMQVASAVIGPDAFDYGIAAAGGKTGFSKGRASIYMHFPEESKLLTVIQNGIMEITTNAKWKFQFPHK